MRAVQQAWQRARSAALPSLPPAPVPNAFRPANARDKVIEAHGDRVIDAYAWLEHSSRAYAAAELAYAKRIERERLAHMRRALETEIVELHRAHLPSATRAPPERIGAYEYTIEQQPAAPPVTDLPRLMRRVCINANGSSMSSSNRDVSAFECILDPGELQARWGGASAFFQIGAQKLSACQRYLAVTFDTRGAERYRVRVRDLQAGAFLDDFQSLALDVGSVEWASSHPPTLLYTEIDASFRAHRVHRHVVGEPHTRDTLLCDERDASFYADVTRTKDARFALITLNSKTTSEVWALRAEHAATALPCCVRPRRDGVRYFVEHAGHDRLVVVTNAHAPHPNDFAICTAPLVSAADNWDAWSVLLRASDLGDVDGAAARISEIDVQRNHLIVWATVPAHAGAPRVCIVEWPFPDRCTSSHTPASLRVYDVALPAGTQTVRGGFNEFDAEQLRMTCSSVLSADQDFDFCLRTRALRPCSGNAQKEKINESYVCERVRVRSIDGALVPMTLVRHVSVSRNGETPVLMTAYGAYGHPLDLSFDASRFALLRRGWMLAFAHVRGGGDSGGDEVDDGHHRSHSLHAGMDVASARALRIRPQAHSDFEACARWLSESSTAPDAQPPWSQSARIAVQAHSAGGLLLGVAARDHGRTLFAAMIAHSPFVDILGAMCSSPPTRDDASSGTTTASHIGALQAHERAEWGDLLGVPAVWRMWRDRLAPLAVPRAAPTPYAHTLITAAQHDSRVPVSDALKWTAAMREHALIEKGIRVSNEYAAMQGTRAQSETAAATLTLCRVDEKEGGHFGASTFEARVRQTALEYAFLMHTVQGKNTVTPPLDTPRL